METGTASVLIVDDEKTIRHTLRDLLSSRGFFCGTAASAHGGLKALEERVYDLVVADINMPGEDGIWLLKQVREAFPDTAVVMLTGVGDVRIAVGCLKLGAYD